MQMISTYRSRGPKLYSRQKFIFEAHINISGEEAQNSTEKLKYPIDWRILHHDFDQEFFRKLSLSKIAREALREAVSKHGLTGSQIRHMQEVERTKSKELSTWELMKVKNRQLRYILSQNP